MRHIQTYNFGIDDGVMVRLDDYKQLEAENAALRTALVAAVLALKSYQFGNQSPELARSVVEKIEEILECHDHD